MGKFALMAGLNGFVAVYVFAVGPAPLHNATWATVVVLNAVFCVVNICVALRREDDHELAELRKGERR